MSNAYASLKPLRWQDGLSHQFSFGAFDCETKDGLKGKEIFCWGLAYPDRYSNKPNVLQDYESLDPLFDYLKDRINPEHTKNPTELIIWVHNLGFDIRFIEDYCIKHEIERFPILSGSKMIAYSIESLKVRFMDSVQFLFSSQEQAEITFNIDKELRKINCRKIFEKNYELWSESEKEKVFAHNKNDILALWQIMKQFRQDMFDIVNVDILSVVSLASMSMKGFRKHLDIEIENPFVYFTKDKNGKLTYDFDKEKDEFVRLSYYGGRNEVFSLNPSTNMVYFDIVSLYPSVMRNKYYPIGIPSWIKGHKEVALYSKVELMGKLLHEFDMAEQQQDKDKLSNLRMRIRELEPQLKLGFFQVEVKPKYYRNQEEIELKEESKRSNYPILPIRKFGKVCWSNEELNEANRTEKGLPIYATPEIIYAIRNGYELTFKKALIYPKKAKLFQSYMDKLFDLKSHSKGGKRMGAKIAMNSLYGKFGQKFEQDRFKMEFYPTREEMIMAKELGKAPIKYSEEYGMYYYCELESDTSVKPYQNVAIASHVTSYARMELLKMIHTLVDNYVYTQYCDTDSVVIPECIYQDIVNGKMDLGRIKVGKELGNWDLEHKFEYFKALAPKAYITIIDGDIKAKLKGIARSRIEEIIEESISVNEVEEKLREPIEMVERYATFKQSLRNGFALSTRKLCKHYSFEYNKRIVLPNLETKPWGDC